MSKENPLQDLEILQLIDIECVIIDGLDGSGKGELTNRISKKLEEAGYDPILIDFPRYHLESGKAIKTELKNPQLNIIQRLNLYALNRLEGLEELVLQVIKSFEEGKNPFIVFDRFTTSNLISIAYELSKSQPELLSKSIEEISQSTINLNGIETNFRQIFEMILNIEHDFLNYLNLEDNFKVIIPEISPEITLTRMDNDMTRGDGTNNRDSYEQSDVQELSAKIYRAVASLFPDRFIFVEQSGRNPDEITEEILSLVNIDVQANIKQIERILSIDIQQLRLTIAEWKAQIFHEPSQKLDS